MYKKILALMIIAGLVTGCGQVEVKQVSQTESLTAESPENISPEGTTQETNAPAETSKGTNNEAAKLVDEAFSKDSYHLAAYIRYKGFDSARHGQAIVINALSDKSALDSSAFYHLSKGFIADVVNSEGWDEDDVNGPSYQHTISLVQDKEMRAEFSQVGDVWEAHAIEKSFYETLDAIGSENFSDLKVDGNKVTGRTSIAIFDIDSYAATGRFSTTLEMEGFQDIHDAEVTCEMVVDDGLVSLKAYPDDDSFLFCMETLEGPAQGGELPEGSIVRFQEGSDDLMKTTGESTYDFSSLGEDTILQWAREGKGDTDTNGFKFRFTYTDLIQEVGCEYIDPDTITIEDVYIDPFLFYGDFKTLGDVNETVRRFNEWKYSVTGSEEDKKMTREKHYKAYDRTDGLPEWYYNHFYNDDKFKEY